MLHIDELKKKTFLLLVKLTLLHFIHPKNSFLYCENKCFKKKKKKPLQIDLTNDQEQKNNEDDGEQKEQKEDEEEIEYEKLPNGATKAIRIGSYPTILRIMLKRYEFNWDTNVYRKVSAHMDIDLELDLSQFSTEVSFVHKKTPIKRFRRIFVLNCVNSLMTRRSINLYPLYIIKDRIHLVDITMQYVGLVSQVNSISTSYPIW